jgi:hypothetical protein
VPVHAGQFGRHARRHAPHKMRDQRTLNTEH